jgi:phosphopantetheinyl transferase
MNDVLQEIHSSIPFRVTFQVSEIKPVSDSDLKQLYLYEKNELKEIANKKRRREYVTSRIVLKKMAREWGIEGEFKILKNDLGRPYGRTANKNYYVSIAHTNHKVFCGLAEDHELGVDMEPVERAVPERLMDRIMHPNEEKMLSDVKPIQLWTIKEALVKLEGQGLRRNMNEIQVYDKKNQFFAELNNDKRAKICSFNTESNWLAVAFYQ